MRLAALLIFLIGSLLTKTYAQGIQLERAVIASAGSFQATNNLQVQATVGELLVQTAQNGSLVLTQGFQQPRANEPTSRREVLGGSWAVYPNPTRGGLHINSTAPLPDELQLLSLHGQVITTWRPEQGQTHLQVQLSQLAPGPYLLRTNEPQWRAQTILLLDQ